MYCSECGKVISDKSKFCRYCGAVIEPEETAYVNKAKATPVNNAKAAPVSAPKSDPVKPPVTATSKPVTSSVSSQEKKKEKETFFDRHLGTFVVLFILLIVSLTVSDWASSCNLLGDCNGSESKTSTESQLPTAKSNTAEYNALFEGIYIVHPQIISIDNTVGYAQKDEYGNITCMDYCYDDDGVVHSMKITEYSNTNGFTDEQLIQLENDVREADARFVGVECITITYNKGAGYFARKVSIDGLENKDSRTVLNKIGFNIDDDKNISMAVTEKEMLADGFIKR